MVVRIRFERGARKGSKPVRNAPLVAALGGLIMLVAISCLGLGMWRLTSDLGWTNAFAIPDGLLSHEQVWIALAVVFGAFAVRLMRYGRPPEERPGRVEEPSEKRLLKPKAKDPAAMR